MIMRNFKIHIPTPCHAEWNSMTPNSEGKFCGSCQKTVVDFTSMSDDEIRNYFTKNYSAKVCGHFKSSQITPAPLFIGRKLNHLYDFLESTRKPYFFKAAALFIVGVCMTFAGCVQRTTGAYTKPPGKPSKNEGRLMGDTIQTIEKDDSRLMGKIAIPQK
jgi:hypothetical protein